MFNFLLLLIIASVCGSIGARIAGRDSMGCLTSIALGFIGALIGRWLADQFELPELWAPQDFPVVWAIIGAALFVAVVNLISGRK